MQLMTSSEPDLTLVAYFQVYWTNPRPSQCPRAAHRPPATCIRDQMMCNSRRSSRRHRRENQDSDINLTNLSTCASLILIFTLNIQCFLCYMSNSIPFSKKQLLKDRSVKQRTTCVTLSSMS